MSIRLIDQYPNRVDPTSADYPHGEPRNKTAPDATDGTPYEEAWYKDQEGYFQGLIEAAGITPSGNPDTVPDSDYLAALVQVASGVTEIDVGGSGDVTLDYNQSRINALRLTGALAADIDLIVPDTERIYLIINETSGSFNVTVRTSGGTGVVVKDSVDQVRSDGTDVVRAIVTEVKNNFEATSAPTATDDETDGYSVGSIWVDISADQPYICVDASAGAAVWQNFSYQIANQSEAEAGTNNTKLMTPERTSQAIDALNPFGNALLHVQDQKASGTDGGALSTTSSWVTRDLTQVVTNEISGASLSGNAITLPAGTYYIEGSSPCSLVDTFQMRLYDNTNSTELVLGTTSATDTGNVVTVHSFVNGRFTLSGQADVVFQINGNGANDDSRDLGKSRGITTEIYSDVRIWKVD